MAYLIDTQIKPSSEIFGKFSIRRGNYDRRLEGKPSRLGDIPRSIELNVEAPPDAMSLGNSYVVISSAIRDLVAKYKSNGIQYVSVYFQVASKVKTSELEYYLIDQAPRSRRLIPSMSSYSEMKNWRAGRSLMYLVGDPKLWVMRRSSGEDPDIWTEDSTIEGGVMYGGTPGDLFVSDELWGELESGFPDQFWGWRIQER